MTNTIRPTPRSFNSLRCRDRPGESHCLPGDGQRHHVIPRADALQDAFPLPEHHLLFQGGGGRGGLGQVGKLDFLQAAEAAQALDVCVPQGAQGRLLLGLPHGNQAQLHGSYLPEESAFLPGGKKALWSSGS